MTKCARCKKRGTVNSYGLCPWCEYDQALKDYDNALHRAKRIAFDNVLKSITPRTVSLSQGDPTFRKVPICEMPDYAFSRITRRSDIKKLGEYVVIDIETTGLNKRNHEIVEVSAVRFRDFVPTEYLSSLVKPRHVIPDDITEINHITNEMVENAPAFSQLIPALSEFIGSSAIVGHNLSFDLEFLFVNGLNLFSQKRKFYDTLDLAKKVLTESTVYNFKLDTLCDYYSIYRGDAHRSTSDCLATGILFGRLVSSKIGAAVGFELPRVDVGSPPTRPKIEDRRYSDNSAKIIGNIFLALTIPFLIMLFSGKFLLMIIGFLGATFFGMTGAVFKILKG